MEINNKFIFRRFLDVLGLDLANLGLGPQAAGGGYGSPALSHKLVQLFRGLVHKMLLKTFIDSK